jgi:hypothetical protein
LPLAIFDTQFSCAESLKATANLDLPQIYSLGMTASLPQNLLVYNEIYRVKRQRFMPCLAGQPIPSRISTPEEVVAAGLKALERNQSYVIPGWINFFL